MTTTTSFLDLAAVETGRYAVTTIRGSQYVIDLDERTLTRRPDTTNERSDDLRRDGDTVSLLKVVRCVIGQRAVFAINLDVPDVPFTVRDTTEVAAVNQLA